MTWLDLPANTGFGLDNLPYGIFSAAGTDPRTGIAIGDRVLDLAAVTGDPIHATGSLNAFMARGPGAWRALRHRLTTWLTDEAHRDDVEPHLLPRHEATLHLPFEVTDYVDFYSSQHHAENVGRIFRAGTVAVSGTPVVRPSGQRKAPSDDLPSFGPSQRLDIEAEVGFVVGQVLPHLGLALGRAAGRPRRRADRPAARGRAAARLPRRHVLRVGVRHHPRGPAQRRAGQPPAVRGDVLDGGAAACAHDRERRRPAHR
jgi:hypothetical protein